MDRYQVSSNEILIVWNHGGDNEKQLESAIKFSIIIIGIFLVRLIKPLPTRTSVSYISIDIHLPSMYYYKGVTN